MAQEYPIDNTETWSSIKLNKSGPMTSMYYGLGNCSEDPVDPETKICSTPLIVFGNPNIPSSVIKSPPNAIKKLLVEKIIPVFYTVGMVLVVLFPVTAL